MALHDDERDERHWRELVCNSLDYMCARDPEHLRQTTGEGLADWLAICADYASEQTYEPPEDEEHDRRLQEIAGLHIHATRSPNQPHWEIFFAEPVIDGLPRGRGFEWLERVCDEWLARKRADPAGWLMERQ